MPALVNMPASFVAVAPYASYTGIWVRGSR